MKLIAKIVAAVLIVGAVLLQCLPRAPRRPPDTLASLATELGVSFPPSTHLIGVRRMNGMDDWLGLKVEMSGADWPAFLASTPVKEEGFAPGGRDRLGSDKGFWDPRQHHDLRTAQAGSAGGTRAFKLGIAGMGAPKAVVFIVDHGL